MQTPVNVFRAPEGFLIALTYGRESENFSALTSSRFDTKKPIATAHRRT